jgi:sugar/nucleoside kinase (ribokinase family)
MALHEQCLGATDEYTPAYIFEAMGCQFDTDAASPGQHITPWIPAKRFITSTDYPDWKGFTWLNPPFGLDPWLAKFFEHNNGVALVPDRTSAPWWQSYVPHADLVLFVRHKIKFIGADGKEGKSPAQGTCLLALGHQGVEALRRAKSLGSIFYPNREAA